MGASGGIIVFNANQVRENWKEIREKCIKFTKVEINKNDSEFSVEFHKQSLIKLKNTPKRIDTNEQLVKVLRSFMRNCDLPYSLGDNLICSYGDYTFDYHEIYCSVIRSIVEYKHIETWT